LFGSLELDWQRAERSAAMLAVVRSWAATEPALAGCANAASLIARVTWDGYRPSPEGALVLSALLRQATSPLGARALLQALLPRIRAERVSTPTYGHGLGQGSQRLADTVADLVAESFAAIRRHAGEDRDDVARLVVQEATRRLRTARQAQRRYENRTVIFSADHAARSTGDLWAAFSGPERLASAVVEAVRRGQLSASDARLVYAARVTGLPASEVGRRQALAPGTVYRALARAERALLRGAA
jgi:DNA-directed RNA polymerase specialized sigma24 family protein